MAMTKTQELRNQLNQFIDSNPAYSLSDDSIVEFALTIEKMICEQN